MEVLLGMPQAGSNDTRYTALSSIAFHIAAASMQPDIDFRPSSQKMKYRAGGRKIKRRYPGNVM